MAFPESFEYVFWMIFKGLASFPCVRNRCRALYLEPNMIPEAKDRRRRISQMNLGTYMRAAELLILWVLSMKKNWSFECPFYPYYRNYSNNNSS
jgi:hypothetical protein